MNDQMNISGDSLSNEQNKDINDLGKSGIGNISPAEAIKHIDELKNSKNERKNYNILNTVLETQKKLRELKATNIQFSEPVLKQGENNVIFPHTINVIQGQAGVHKSRLAEIICSALLRKVDCKNELLDYKKTNVFSTHTVVYVDTERNLSEQLPYALQSIQIKAGYNKEDHPDNFEYISLMPIKRKQRFEALEKYLKHIKLSTNNPLFIVLDVSTDCIEDFNRTDKSMELIDLMNMAINEHNVIFLCVIHENPRSEKARGHFGTELMNKASTVMQVGFENGFNQEDSDIIRVKYLKCRSTAKHIPFHIKYSKEAKGLVLADPSEVSGIINNRKHKAPIEDIVEFIQQYLGDGSAMKRVDLLDKLCIDFDASQRIIEERIKDIRKSGTEFFNDMGNLCKLLKEKREKELYYKLVPNEPS